MRFDAALLRTLRHRGRASAARLVVLVVFALVSALEPLFQPDVFQNYAAGAIFEAFSRRLLECLCIMLTIFAAVAVVERRPPQQVWLYTLALFAAAAAGSAVGCGVWGVFMFRSRFADAFGFLVNEAFLFAVLGGFLTVVDGFLRRSRDARDASRELQAANAALEAQTELATLRLLEAQIEPHFLFNTIANLRRTWRVDNRLGERMHDNVVRYLAAALPQMRSPTGTLGEEIELVRAYLELFAIRMGDRLSFSIDASKSALPEAFPRMVLLTLVENAIKHGLAPAENGGHVAVIADIDDARLRVSVTDNGVGFGAANTGGTGIGLANIRARLLTAYGRSARLEVGSGANAGVVATITLPLAPTSETRADVRRKELTRSSPSTSWPAAVHAQTA